MNKISKTEYNNIVALYNSGLSAQKIGDMYAVYASTIRKILNKCNVQMRDDSHKYRKYTLNENYFDVIDDQNKAYILGLLYADGCNYTKTNMIKLELQERDRDILEKINSKLNSNRVLEYIDLHSKNENWQSTYRLTIVNKHMSQTLNDIGMVPRKSLILEFPTCLEKDLYSHFIRGYIDGDGCIYNGKQKFITCATTKQFCESIINILQEELNIHTYYRDIPGEQDSPTKLLYIGGISKIKTFLDYIYEDAELYIQRKYDTYKSFCHEILYK